MRAFALSILVLLAGPAALANAATVVRTGTGYRLEAAPGEVNQVVIAVGEDDVVLADGGAPLGTTAPDCVPLNANAVRCSESPEDVAALLGDGADRLQITGEPVGVQVAGGDGDDELALTGEIVEASGDAGDDLLAGGPGEDTLSGGDGADDLRGGEGDDFLDGGAGDDALDGGGGTDLVTYGKVAVPVTVDLADPAPDGPLGERDVLSAIENVRGGTAADRLLGDGADNYLTGGGGRDRLEGRGGRDGLRATHPGAVLRGGAGNDTLESGGARDARCGAGRDELEQPFARRLVAADCELARVTARGVVAELRPPRALGRVRGGAARFRVRVEQAVDPDDTGSEEGEGEDEGAGSGVKPVVAAVRLLDARGRVLGRGTRTARGIVATVPVPLTAAARAALRRDGELRAVLAVGRGARVLVLIR